MQKHAPILAPFEGLRGLAALAVFVYHFHHVGTLSAGAERLAGSLGMGWIFVDVFFVLSGWVIAHVYADRFTRDMGGTLRPFLVARIARLFPLVLCVLTVWGIGAAALGQWGDVARTLDCMPQYLTLTFTWGPLYCAPTVAPAWSVSAELVAYLVFPILVGAGALRTPACGLLLIASGLAAYIAMEFAWGSFHVLDARAPLRAIAGFAIGCGLWRIGCTGSAFGHSERSASGVQWLAATVFCMALLLPAAPLVILIAAVALMWTLRQSGGQLARLLSTRPAMVLGRLSFGLYLWHWFAIRILHAGGGTVSLGDMVVAVLAVLVVSELFYRLVEAPARDAIRLRLGAGNAGTAAGHGAAREIEG